jgi:hypothetical protein
VEEPVHRIDDGVGVVALLAVEQPMANERIDLVSADFDGQAAATCRFRSRCSRTRSAVACLMAVMSVIRLRPGILPAPPYLRPVDDTVDKVISSVDVSFATAALAKGQIENVVFVGSAALTARS